MDQLVKALRDHALANYATGGWDIVVECWTDEEIAAQLRFVGATTVKDAIMSFGLLVEVWRDRQADADSYKES